MNTRNAIIWVAITCSALFMVGEVIGEDYGKLQIGDNIYFTKSENGKRWISPDKKDWYPSGTDPFNFGNDNLPRKPSPEEMAKNRKNFDRGKKILLNMLNDNRDWEDLDQDEKTLLMMSGLDEIAKDPKGFEKKQKEWIDKQNKIQAEKEREKREREAKEKAAKEKREREALEKAQRERLERERIERDNRNIRELDREQDRLHEQGDHDDRIQERIQEILRGEQRS